MAPAPAPCPPSLSATPPPSPLQQQRLKRQDFTHPASTGPVFPTSSSTVNLFADPTSTPTGASISGGGTSALPSDVFIWIFVLIASGLVLLTALYRIWRLRQLNRSMSTFFRTGGPLPPQAHPINPHAFAHPPNDPRHPEYHAYWQSAYPPFSYPAGGPAGPAHPGRAVTRVQGEGIGAGGRRLDSTGGLGDKEELPAYERGTLPGYGDVVGYSGLGQALGGRQVDGEGWEVVEMDRLGSPAYDAPSLPLPVGAGLPREDDLPAPLASAGEMEDGRAEGEVGGVRPQTTGGTGASNNPFRRMSPPPRAHAGDI